MSLIWLDGFEGYGTSGFASASLDCRYASVGGGESIVAGRWSGGHAMIGSGAGDRVMTPVITTDATTIVSFAMKPWATNPLANAILVQLYDGLTAGVSLRPHRYRRVGDLLRWHVAWNKYRGLTCTRGVEVY